MKVKMKKVMDTSSMKNKKSEETHKILQTVIILTPDKGN